MLVIIVSLRLKKRSYVPFNKSATQRTANCRSLRSNFSFCFIKIVKPRRLMQPKRISLQVRSFFRFRIVL